MDQPPALPRRVAWFAPWMWRPWKRWAMVGLAFVLYVEAVVPLSLIEEHSRDELHPHVWTVATWIWSPVGIAVNQSDLAADFLDVQIEACNSVINTVFDDR